MKKLLIFSFIFSVLYLFPMTAFARGDIYDIVLFFGQSNMVGMSSDHENIDISEGIAYEYLYSTNELKPVTTDSQTFGEKLKYDSATQDLTLVSDTDTETVASITPSKGTNVIPQFVKTYNELTGHKVIVVFAAKGSNQIAYFLPHNCIEKRECNGEENCETHANLLEEKINQYLYETIVKKYNSAVAKAESYISDLNRNLDDNNKVSIGHKFYVIYQGEDDVRLIQNYPNSYKGATCGKTNYYDRYMYVHESLKKDCGIEFGEIVEASTKVGAADRYEGLMLFNSELRLLVSDNNDIILGSNFPFNHYVPDQANYHGDLDYSTALANATSYMLSDNLHFKASALSVIGGECATNAATYLFDNFYWLNSLSVNGNNIVLSDSLNYNYSILNDVDKVDIDATLLGSSLEFVDGFGPKTINVNEGNNEVILKIRNKNTNDVKTFTINVFKEKRVNDSASINNNSNNNVEVPSTSSFMSILFVFVGILLIILGVVIIYKYMLRKK